MARRVVAAVDIGASGGRVIAGLVENGHVALDAVHRFSNAVVRRDGHLRWDVTGLFEQVVRGLGVVAERYPECESIGIDTWAVDYGLLDTDGRLLADPVAYRDPRTDAVVDRVHERVPKEALFAINGLQFLPFNTLYQLAAEQQGPAWEKAARIALLPDLLAYWLTGRLRTEYTNATTTGLVDVRTGDWSPALLEAIGVPADLLPPIERPGAVRGTLLPAIAARTGLNASTVVTAVGSHDTASAVVGVPAAGDRFAYVASGTWSLVGVELPRALLTPAALAANFTNEGGVDGRIRFLRNVGGLWLLQESLRAWEAAGAPHALGALLDAAASLPGGGATVDVDDAAFIPPDDMPARIAAAAAATGRPAPASPPAIVRCILDSLASAYARTLQTARELTGRAIDLVHVVGGGSQIAFLCRLTADAAGIPVVAGPVEATALGNVLVQARAIGAVAGDLEALRALSAASSTLQRYDPS